MTEKASPKRSWIILLLLALLTSPLACCGGMTIASAIPGVTTGLFETEVTIENKSGETFYITPITTTYAEPRTITQPGRIRQVDIPLKAGDDILLSYDAADFPLAGLTVCREAGECRMLETEYRGITVLDSFESLPELEPGWLKAKQAALRYRFGIIIYPLLGLTPIILFLNWLYLVWREKKK